MRLTTSSTALANCLLSLSKVFNSKNTLPILNCYLFEVKDNVLTISASDSENLMTMALLLESSDSEGVFAINSQTILDAVRELPEQPLTLDIDMTTYAIEAYYQNGKYNFAAQSGEDFPRFTPMVNPMGVITMASKTLSGDISRALFATNTQELRPVMSGVFFDMTPEFLAVVASDGHKLVRTKNLNIKTQEPISFILPKKPSTLLKGVLPKNDDEVVIKFDDKNAIVEFGLGMLSCRLLEGRYPNYNAVIPKDNPNLLTLDRSMFLSAIRRVLPFASESSKQVRLHIEMGKLVITSEDIDFNTSAKEELTCDYNGNTMDIGFKGSSLAEILSNIDSESVVLELADPSRPCLVIPTEHPEHEDILMLIMPMLLND